MRLILGESAHGSPIIETDLFQGGKDFTKRRAPSMIGRHVGCLKNVENAKEITGVWVGAGWAVCSVEWLRGQGCPETLINPRPNDWEFTKEES